MSKSKKQQSALGKLIYMITTDSFHKCTAVNEYGQPTQVQKNGNTLEPIPQGYPWVVASNRRKVITAFFAVITSQVKAIDSQAIYTKELEIKLKELGIEVQEDPLPFTERFTQIKN